MDGEQIDFHWWNRFLDGTGVDLTEEQFSASEKVVGAVSIERPRGSHGVEERYARSRKLVLQHLADDDSPGSSWVA